MKSINRTKATMLNTSFASVAQLVQLIFQFVSRTIFIHMLGVQLIGLNSLFTNILSYLNFAELGIGSAITFSLYKPLAENKWQQVSAIMRLFKRLYEIIAIVVLVGGILTTAFIPKLIKGGIEELPVNVYIAFILALLNTVVSYLVTYKRTLLIADQRGYLNTLNSVGYNVAGQIFQIISLLVWKNFYIYLIIQAASMLISNLRVSKVVDRVYPLLEINTPIRVDKTVLVTLKQNISGMISSKLGGIIVNGTDNILLSMFVGLTQVGLYSNYAMITSGLTQVFNQFVSAVASSIGNLGATSKRRTKVKQIFYQYFVVSSSLALMITVGFASFSTAFVSIWLGKSVVYSALPLFVITLNFYLQSLRQSLITYTASYGLFWYARWKPIFESAINFGCSLWLVKYTSLGVSGVLIGTIISNLIVNVVWESIIVTRHAVNESFFRFIRLYLSFIIAGTLTIGATVWYIYVIGSSVLMGILGLVVAEIVSFFFIVLIDLVICPNRFSLIRTFIGRRQSS